MELKDSCILVPENEVIFSWYTLWTFVDILSEMLGQKMVDGAGNPSSTGFAQCIELCIVNEGEHIKHIVYCNVTSISQFYVYSCMFLATLRIQLILSINNKEKALIVCGHILLCLISFKYFFIDSRIAPWLL